MLLLPLLMQAWARCLFNSILILEIKTFAWTSKSSGQSHFCSVVTVSHECGCVVDAFAIRYVFKSPVKASMLSWNPLEMVYVPGWDHRWEWGFRANTTVGSHKLIPDCGLISDKCDEAETSTIYPLDFSRPTLWFRTYQPTTNA